MATSHNHKFIENAISTGQYPKYLYKYAKLDTGFKILENHSCWFSSFHDFNDPYEGRYSIMSKYTVKQWQDYLTSMGLTQSFAKEEAAKLCTNSKVAEKNLQKHIQEAIDNSGIFCISSTNNNMLLWSYYAKDHKGICIEFSPLEDADFFTNQHLLPVHYSNIFPEIDFLNHRDSIVQAITQKAECWIHEEEWRVINCKRTKYAENINSKSITSLILGFKNGLCDSEIDFNLFDKLINILKQPHYSHIRIKQVNLEEKDYKIDLVDAPFIARTFNKRVKITALKNTKLVIPSLAVNRTLNKWQEVEYSIDNDIVEIRDGKDFSKTLLAK